MDNRRVRRIEEEMKKELSDIIQNKLKDPRIPEFTSVSFVDVTNDLSQAKIGISVLSRDSDRQQVIEGLETAKGFIKRELGSNLKLRAMPELIFISDESIEKSIEMQKLIDSLHEKGEF